MTTAPARQYVNPGTPSRMIDRLREGAAVIYLESEHVRVDGATVPQWTTGDASIGGGISTSMAASSKGIIVSTIVLLDPKFHAEVMRLRPRLLLCYEDAPGSYRPVSSPSDHEGTQFVPVVEPPNRAAMVRTQNWPIVQGIWRVVLNVTAIDPHTVEYLNGDRFDLRAANLRLVEA